MTYYWAHSSGRVPPKAVRAGRDKDGGNIYVGRAYHEGDFIPAKVVENHMVAYVAYDGREHPIRDFDVLCVKDDSKVLWSNNRDGNVTAEAVPCGQTSNEETLYVGRVLYKGTQTPGKIHPSHGCCYIPYDGKEMSFKNYEELIILE